MVDFNYSLGAVANGGVSPSENVPTEYPVALMASATGNAKFRLADSISLNLDAALWAGYNNQILDRSAASQSTVLRWYEDRYAVFQTRTPLSPEDNVAGINELSATLGFDSIGLSLKLAAFSQIENKAYPYTHNAATGLQTLQLGGFDTNSPADYYNPYIGPLAAVIWDAPVLPGLQLLYQVGAAGGTVGAPAKQAMEDAFDLSKLFHVVQAKYAHTFDNGTTLTGVGYFTAADPSGDDVTATGEKISDTLGGGFGVMLSIPNAVSVDFGYSAKSTNIDGDGVHIKSRFDGVNLSFTVPVKDILQIAAGYSWLGFTEETKAFIDQLEETGEHAVEFRVLVPLLNNQLGLSAGYRGTFVDKENTLSPTGGDRHVLSVGLQGLLGGSL